MNGSGLSDNFLVGYPTAMRQAAESALTNLNTTVNWALTLTLGVVAFVIQAVLANDQPSVERQFLGLVMLAIALAMLVHFGIRTAKSYINLMRFALLEEAALKLTISAEKNPADFLKAIETYHLMWRSPLRIRTIAWKVFLEFGFWYLFLFTGAVYLYLVYNAPHDYWQWEVTITVVMAVAVMFELTIFGLSPYIKVYVAHDSTSKKA